MCAATSQAEHSPRVCATQASEPCLPPADLIRVYSGEGEVKEDNERILRVCLAREGNNGLSNSLQDLPLMN